MQLRCKSYRKSVCYLCSSVSSSMNSLSAVTWKDMMEWKFHYIPEWKKALITKVLGITHLYICRVQVGILYKL